MAQIEPRGAVFPATAPAEAAARAQGSPPCPAPAPPARARGLARPAVPRAAWRALRLLSVGVLLALLGCGGGAGDADYYVASPPVAEGPALATFVFVGDTIAHGMDPGIDPLADVASLLEGADVFMLNQEGVLLPRPLPATCAHLPTQSLLDADPRSAASLARAPVVVATLANNHILDCDGEGLASTQLALRTRGFLTVGAGLDPVESCATLRFAAGGLDVACAAYLAISPAFLPSGPGSPGTATWEGCDGAARVATLKAGGAFVVAALHLHLAPSWTSETAAEHVTFVERVLDAGADIVVAHGSHVPQGLLTRRGKVAFLSLGNFLFALDRPIADAARDIVIARVAVHPRQLLITLSAARLDLEGRPRLPAPADVDRILGALLSMSRTIGTPLVRSADRAYLLVDR